MFDLIGLFSVFLVSLFFLLIALKKPIISKIIFVALSVRIILLFIGQIIDLPDSTSDAENFEYYAWFFAKDGFSNIFTHFRGPDPFFVSWLIAIPYSLLDRSELMAQSFSLLFGMGSVCLGWLVTKKIWDKDIANKVGMTIALFPSLILYSVLIMREAYIVFFLLLGLYGVVDWAKTGSFKSIILTLFSFFMAACFHGAMIIGGIIFLIIFILINTKKLIKSLIIFRLNVKILISILSITGIGFYILNNVHIPYLESFDYATNVKVLFQKTSLNTKGGASWPDWLVISTPVEMIYKMPLRSIYFLYAPFPWDVSEIKHLIGVFDASIFMYFTFLIFKSKKNIFRDPVLIIFLIILIFYVLVFGIGAGNFGTGIRHRSKFAVLFIILAAPSINKFILNSKNYFSNKLENMSK